MQQFQLSSQELPHPAHGFSAVLLSRRGGILGFRV